MEKIEKAAPPEEELPPALQAAEADGPPVISPVEYKTVDAKNVKIEWTQRGDDYIYQWHPKRPPKYAEDSVTTMIVSAVDPIMPRETHVYFDLPNHEMRMNFWTIRVEKIAGRPGAKVACEETMLKILSEIDVWT